MLLKFFPEMKTLINYPYMKTPLTLPRNCTATAAKERKVWIIYACPVAKLS